LINKYVVSPWRRETQPATTYSFVFTAAPKLQAHSPTTNLLSLVLNEFTQFSGELF